MKYKVINREDMPKPTRENKGKYYEVLDYMKTTGVECVEITEFDGAVCSEYSLIYATARKYFDGGYRPRQRSGRLFIVKEV